MSDLMRDIAEEDEVRRLLSRAERELETPSFETLSRRRQRVGLLQTSAVLGVATLLVVAALGLPTLLRSGSAAAPENSPTPVTPTAVPRQDAPGGAPSNVTTCADIPMPTYLPYRSAASMRSARSAVSEDVVTLIVEDLVVNGDPAELSVSAQAAPPQSARAGSTRQVGDRVVTLTAVRPGSSTPPPGSVRRIPVRSEVAGLWSEPTTACPYFAATLMSSGTNAQALESELAKIIDSMPLSPAAAKPVEALVASETEVWSRIRAAFPTGPVAMPIWLPSEVDRSRVELRILRTTPTREYEVVYRDAAGASLLNLRLGPVQPVQESAVSMCCVRGAQATLHLATRLFSDPALIGMRQMRWEEQRRTLTITSERIKGEDMLRIAWSLDRTTAPPNAYLSSHPQSGACASSTSAEGTVVRLLSLTGSGNRDALIDCYSSDAIAVGGLDVASWAGLPATKDVAVSRGADVAGRTWVAATWRFTSAAGGPWGEVNTRFFLLGREEGVWRIYEVGSAPFSTPP